MYLAANDTLTPNGVLAAHLSYAINIELQKEF